MSKARTLKLIRFVLFVPFVAKLLSRFDCGRLCGNIANFMKQKVRIAAGQGFWGDLLDAPVRQVEGGPIDYLMLDYLAEVTMSIMQKQKARDPNAGYAKDFVPLMRRILPTCVERDIKVTANAGGVNVRGCADAVIQVARELGLGGKLRIGIVTGDDIMSRLDEMLSRGIELRNMDTGEPLSTVREDRVQEGNVGIWMDTTTRWTDWLRTTVGIREDIFAGRVLSDTPENSGNAQASMTSPKAGIVLGPWYKTEFYGNAGYGLHSNDIRGTTITVDPIDKVTPQDRVPLLVRSKGAEIGVRTKAVEGLTSSLAVFVLDFDSELLFVGDAGTTEPSRPSRRVGVEWTNQYQILPWMRLDLDVAYTRARFTDFDPAGDFIPGAPAWVAAGGVTFGSETGWFGALRGRYFGPRPLIEDDSVRSQASLIFNARAGYKFDNGLRLQLDVLNLFNAKTNQIEYYYLSRLPGEPIGGVADRHVHPAEPLAVRLTLAGRF